MYCPRFILKLHKLLIPTTSVILAVASVCLLCLLFNGTAKSVTAVQLPQTTNFDCTTVSGIPQVECEALIALYDSTNGPDWTEETNWLKTKAPCDWHGVKCTEGNVKTIILANNRLSGTIPSALGNLAKLTSIKFYTNSLTGPIPSALGNLAQLKTLFLSHNQLSGPIPPELGKLTKLTGIYMSHNRLSGPIPPELGKLPNLTKLYLRGNALSGSIPPALGKLSKLQILSLSRNQLSGRIPSTLSNLSELQTLSLSHNQLGGRIPENVVCLKSLLKLSLDYNKLTASSEKAKSCLDNLNPPWSETQTVPPANIQAVVKSDTSIQLTWTPIRYKNDGGAYEVIITSTTGNPSRSIYSTANKRSPSYTITDLTANTNYEVVVRTHTPPHGLQQNDLWSDSSPPVSVCMGPKFPVTVTHEAGIPISNTQVYAKRGDQLIAVGGNGQRTTNLAHGDKLLATSLIYTQTTERAAHDGWSYRIYITNMDIGDTGAAILPTVGSPCEVVVKKSNPLILFNLVASVEQPMYDAELYEKREVPQYLADLETAFINASNFLYDVTDGQFALGQVTIYDDGRHWADADIHFLTSNNVRPNAEVGGIGDRDTHIYLGHSWDRYRGNGSWKESDGYRTLIHELAHYALYLFDSYEETNAEQKILCDSIMASPYDRDILAMEDIEEWSETCTQTQQWQIYEESDWQTLKRMYSDPEGLSRWTLKTPMSVGNHMVGPVALPLDYPIVTIERPEGKPPTRKDITCTVTAPDGGRPEKPVQTFIKRNRSRDDSQIASIDAFIQRDRPRDNIQIVSVGAPETDGTVKLNNAENEDELIAVSLDGSESASIAIDLTNVLTKACQLELQDAPWNPIVNAQPAADWKGLSISVPEIGDVQPETLQATLIEAGNGYSTSVSLTIQTDGTYSNTFAFPAGRKIKAGYILLQADSIEVPSRRVETIASFAIRGAPGSHILEYAPTAPIELDSLDGNLHLRVPLTAVLTTTLVSVMPIRGIKAIANSVASSVSETILELSLPPTLTLIGALYNVRASDAVTLPPQSTQLTLYSDQADNTQQQQIYHWNQRTRQWARLDSVVHTENNESSISTLEFEEFGVYGILIETQSTPPCHCWILITLIASGIVVIVVRLIELHMKRTERI